MKIDYFDISERCLIVAELSANHNGSKQIAIDTIYAAKEAGADAVKLQTYTPDTLTINCDNQYFQINEDTLWDNQTLYELYKQAYTPWEWHEELFKAAKDAGLICFSSPFDNTAVDFLDQFNPPAYKIASFEIQDIPLIKYVASKGKPVILSTGIATERDIQLAIETCRKAGNEQIVLLKCTSSYPAPLNLANLRTITDMRKKFSVLTGLSDHTFGTIAPLVSVSLGAKVIEKHFIIDKNIGGPDASFSLDISQFKKMVTDVRKAEEALGNVSYEIPPEIEKNRKFARSLFIVKDVKKGDKITPDNVRSIRPGYGLHPKKLPEIIGKKFSQELSRGTPLNENHIS